MKWIDTTKYPIIECNCGNRAIINGVSAWHDHSGIFYMLCTKCKKEWNERWFTNKYKQIEENED